MGLNVLARILLLVCMSHGATPATATAAAPGTLDDAPTARRIATLHAQRDLLPVLRSCVTQQTEAPTVDRGISPDEKDGLVVTLETPLTVCPLPFSSGRAQPHPAHTSGTLQRLRC